MSNIKRILFTTAYAKSSKNTWRYALTLAQYFEAEIHLLHVYKEMKPSSWLGDDGVLEQDQFPDAVFDEQKEQEELDRLREFVAQFTPQEFKEIDLHFFVANGNVVEAILQQEKEIKYDLIVLGTSRATTANRFWGGSALKVLAKSSSPVFLVPPMAKYAGIHKIVYATDFESGDTYAIQHLMEWIAAFHAKLHLLHVHKKTYESKRAAQRMQVLVNTFEQENEAGMLNAQLLEGQARESIETYLEQTDADMVALTSHRRSFFAALFNPDITNQIASEVMVPILVFKH